MSYQAAAVAQPKGRPVRTSELLREFASSLTKESVSIGEIVAALGGRGLGVLLAIFSLPNILPSAVPFGNVAFAVPPLIFAVQLMLGFERLMLPRVIADYKIGSGTLKALTPRVAAVLSWFERLLSPRLSIVASQNAERVFGAICVVLAIVAMLPIPFFHNLPSLGLVLIGLGLIESDGLAILIGSAIGIAGVVLFGLVMFGLAHGVGFLLHDVKI